MRIGLIAAVMAGVAIIGSAIFHATVSQALPGPTGRYAVDRSDMVLSTQDGPYPVTVWAPVGEDRNLPLVIQAPGWGGDRRKDSASLSSDIASHGYIVVGYDDLARDASTTGERAQDRADRLASFVMDTVPAYRDSVKLAQRRVVLSARKAQAILDAVLIEPGLADRVDPRRIGFVGFSFGGATGAELSLIDDRVAAVVNLDGWLFGPSGKAPRAPYLLISIPEDFPPADWLRSTVAWRQALAVGALRDQALHRPLMARPDFLWVMADGMGHEDLSDARGQWTLRNLYYAARGRLAPVRASKVAQYALIVGFLDRYLKDGAPSSAPASALPAPGLAKVTPGLLLPESGRQ